MNAEELLALLGELPDEMILEADPENYKVKKRSFGWVKYATTAVAAALVLALSLSFLPIFSDPNLPDNPTHGVQGTDVPSNSGGGPILTTGGSSSVSGDVATDSGSGSMTQGTVDSPVYWQEGVMPETQIFLTPDGLAELFYTIPTGAWGEDEPRYWKDSSGFGHNITQRVFNLLYEKGVLDPETPVIPGDFYNASYPRISVETVENAYLEVWGPFYWEYFSSLIENAASNSFSDGNAILLYEEATDSYIFYNHPFNRFPLESGDHFYGRLLYIVSEGEDLVAYLRFGNYDINDGKFYLMPNHLELWNGEDNPDKPLLKGTHPSNYRENENSVYNRMFAGMFDEYLPVYRVTFKADENGKYWWYSSQKVKEAQEIPAEILSEPLPETRPAGTVVPIYGAHDEESAVKLPQMSYFRPYQGIYLFCITMEENVLDSYCIVPGNDEVLTKKDYVLTFQQNLDGETCTWEVYTSNEWPNGWGIILENVTKGTSQNWYRLER